MPAPDLKLKIYQAVAEIGRSRILASTRSETVKKYLQSRITETGVTFNVPHYWVGYYHDGRGSFGPKDAVWLVYFKNPKDDPRIASGYPVSRSAVRRLTASQYKEGWQMNREMQKRNPGGGAMQYMIVTKHVGPTAETKKDPFFRKGLSNIGDDIRKIATAEIRDYVKQVITIGKKVIIVVEI